MRSVWQRSGGYVEKTDGRPGLGIRGGLLIGFGLVFVLWLASGYDLVRRLAEIEERTAAVTSRFVSSDRELSTVRIRVLLASIYLRDAMFDQTPGMSSYYREQVLSARAEVDRALAAYVPVTSDPTEHEDFSRLRVEVSEFWSAVLPVLASDVTRQAAEARVFLRERLIPKRESIVRMSERIKELNRLVVARHQRDVGAIHAAMRRRIWGTSGLALLGSLVVAIIVTRHATRLEARILEQSVTEAKATADLQRLSARLVNAQEEERRTIARELHDEVGQALTAIKVQLALAARHASLPDKAAQALHEARGIIDRGLHQVRDLSQLLHPAMLDDLGLPATVAWYLDGYSSRTGIATELIQDRMDHRLAPEIETCIYRIIQEALTNVARHARATRCRVYLQRLTHSMLLTVEDDGVGFEPSHVVGQTARAGLGLLGIEERVAGFRGTLRIESAPGTGTRITVELPDLGAGKGDGDSTSRPPSDDPGEETP